MIGRARRGYDAGKKIKGTKRHLAVDTIGLLLTVLVTAASVQDRDAAKPLLWNLRRAFPSVRLAWADGGYAGKLATWAAGKLKPKLTLQIVRRPDDLHTFQVLSRRWVVERTLSWITCHRRTVRDYERLPAHHETYVYWAIIIVMTRRLARPGGGTQPAAMGVLKQALQALKVRTRPLVEVINNAGDSLDESLTGRGAGHEPRLAVLFAGARNAGDVAERGRNTLTEAGFERILADVLQHRDSDLPAADLVDTAHIYITDVRFVGLPEPFLLDRRVLRLDPAYFIAHDVMLTPLKQLSAPRSGRCGMGRLSLASQAAATWRDRRPGQAADHICSRSADQFADNTSATAQSDAA